MTATQEWPSALRHAWLTGGVVAVNEPESEVVQLHTHVAGCLLATFKIPTYGALFPALKSFGIRVLGAGFITDAKQLEGLRAPEFRCAGPSSGWPVWDAILQWRQIAAASSRRNAMQLMDVSARIAASLRYSEMRLYDLTMSYSAQLHSHYDPAKTKDYQSFQDTVSPGVYKDIHALFWEMAVLRDVLAEFIAIFCLSRDNATTLSGLRRSLNKSDSRDPFAVEAMTISDKAEPAAWLFRFGAYRDCFTHSAPLEQAAGIAFAVQDRVTLRGGVTLPQIYFALPADPDDLIRRRAKGLLFSSFRDMAMSATVKRNRAVEPDALEYLHDSLCRFTDLAARLVARSPIAPTPIVITRSDIIGDIQVSRS